MCVLSTSQKSVSFHVHEWPFSGGTFSMFMFVSFFLLFFFCTSSHTIGLIQGGVFSTAWKTNSMRDNGWNQWQRHVIMSLIPAQSVLFYQSIIQYALWIRWQVSCYLNHGIGSGFFSSFFVLQKRWNQDSQQHNESFRAQSEPKGRGPLIQCLDPVSASSSRPSRGPTSAPRDPPSTQPSTRHGTASVKCLTEDFTAFFWSSFPSDPPFSPPLCAHNIKIGWLDSRCLCLKKSTNTLYEPTKKE